jgi:hypothetical protein
LKTLDGTGQMVLGNGTARTRVLTLDSLVAERPRFNLTHLLKVDVDGYDFRVLRGGTQLIRQAQPIIFFEQDPALLERVGEQPDAVWEWLAETGYTHVFLYDNFGFWLGLFPLAETTTLAQLNAYARQRAGFYYDAIAFSARNAQTFQEFENGEKQYYRSLQAPPPAN